MVEERVILTKYGELCVDYKNKHIDDFDNYVRSRLIEYIYNKEHDDIDLIVDTVRRAMGE